MKTIFGNKGLIIGSIALLVIAIQTVSCGGIGLDVAPGNIEVEPDSSITYNITVYNYQDHLDCFDITVIPDSCDAIWFDWWHFGGWWHEEFICIPGNGQEQVSLNVTPDVEGDFNFLVKTVAKNNPKVEASQGVQIAVKEPNQPPINNPPCYGILVPTRAEPQNPGTRITWVAYAEDPDGDTRYYRFWIKGPATSNSWEIKQDWSTNNIWVWDTTSADIGDTDISVWIRDGHHEPTNKCDLEKKRDGYRIE